MWDELKKLLKHSSVYGLGNILSKIVGFLLIPFYTHYLQPTQYGTLEVLDLSLSLITLLMTTWVAAPVTRFYYHYEEEREKKRVISTSLVTAACGGLVLTLVGLHFARQISVLVLQSPDFPLYVKVITLSFFFSCVSEVAWQYQIARQRSTLLVFLKLALLVLSLSLNVYFIAFAHLGVLGVLYSGLITNLLATGIIGVLTLREVGFGFDLEIFKACAAFGTPMILSNLGAFVLNFSDRFFLQRFSTLSVVGVYALGYRFGFMLSFLLIQPFGMIWSAQMYEIDKRKDGRQLFSRFGDLFCLALVIGALGLSVLTKEVIALVAAPSFQGASRIVPLVALAYVFQGMFFYFRTGILIEKRTVYMAVMGLLGAGANILLNFLLIPRYAGMGAAWATVLSFLLMAVMAYIFSQKVYPIPFRLRKLILPLAVGVGVYLLSTRVHASSLWVSAGLKALFVPGFLAAVYLLGFFEKHETERMRSVFSTLWERSRRAEAILPGR
jgi:O-antigen/teichoic acid export membrane protein